MGRTPLHYAALDNAFDTARAMIAQGAELDARDRSGRTPLHFAAQQGSVGLAQLLIDSGAAVDLDRCIGAVTARLGAAGRRQRTAAG